MLSYHWSVLKTLRDCPEKLIESQKRRGEDVSVVEKAIELDRIYRKLMKELDDLRHERNVISQKIGKSKDKTLIEKAKEISKRIKLREKELKEVEDKLNDLLLSIPNMVHESVPMGESDEDNVPIRFWGKCKVFKDHVETFLDQTCGFDVDYEVLEKPVIGHADYVEKTRLADTLRAGKVAGSRFYYLFNDLVWLDFALTLYALDFLAKRGFKIVVPPYMLNRKAYEGVTALIDFEEMLYKIEDEDLYLIATSEHPLASMHMNEVIEENELPLLYAGVSPCFRKEAGSHGKDTKGIFRVHVFNKVEQFVYCHPDQSWEWHEKLIENVEELWRGLGIPHRIVNVCSGDLGVVASKKYDLEAWMPAQGKFREMVSCSNCTDWQSYRLNVRYAEERGAKTKGFVHTLNSTAIATTRAITSIIENFQLEDGRVEIPKVLRKYLEPIEIAPKDYIGGF
jgi:seryl-tRNA synthetase